MEIEDQEQDILFDQEAINTFISVKSVNGKTGTVVLTTSDLENTSDYQTGTQVESAINTAIAGKQDKLTAGDGISIDGNVISNTRDTVEWGKITGDITDQIDLQNQFSSVEGEISDINALIPNQASTENQLADKDFVNSSISSSTANFIGTFDSLAELEAYSGPLTNNDYAFVVDTDAAGNTIYNRYKYNGSEWLFEYSINNSSFTAAQWDALNSGITTSGVEQISDNKDNISALKSNKQDKLIAGDGISIDNNIISSVYYYMGKNLTSIYTTEELSAKVQSGDFSGLHIGDYITKKVKVGSNQERELDFVIAGFDYFRGMGDTELVAHHLVMVPDTAFYETMKMNDTNTTTGGYYGSQAHGIARTAYTAGTGGALTNVVADYEMFLRSTLEPDDGTYTFVRNSSGKWELNSEDVGTALDAYGITYTGIPVEGDTITLTFAKGYLEPYRQAIYAAFGEGHILNHREYISTSASSGAWHDARVELMNESMVYGQMIRAANVVGDMFAKSQLPLFCNEPNRAIAHRGKGGSRYSAWLSSIASGSTFCFLTSGGGAGGSSASGAYAVRPYFLFA